MNQWKSILLIGVCLFLVAGCGKQKPAGVPDLYPAKVTVTNAGTAIAAANIFLVFQGTGTAGSWSANGVTDAKGVAVINTSQGDWKSKGAPAGDYKVFITKAPSAKEDPIPEEIKNDSDALQKFEQEQMKKLQAAPKEIPAELTSPATTQLTLTVASGSPAELTVDVSKHQ